jgi:hypothetical protein
VGDVLALYLTHEIQERFELFRFFLYFVLIQNDDGNFRAFWFEERIDFRLAVPQFPVNEPHLLEEVEVMVEVVTRFPGDPLKLDRGPGGVP